MKIILVGKEAAAYIADCKELAVLRARVANFDQEIAVAVKSALSHRTVALDTIMSSFTTISSKIRCMKGVKELTGMSLGEARDYVYKHFPAAQINSVEYIEDKDT